MRTQTQPWLNLHRIRCGNYGTDDSYGMTGAFTGKCGKVMLRIMASDGSEWPYDPPAWEHVSVSLPNRCPTWDEMEFVRSLFWDDTETVLQFSVPRKDHISYHPFCLHLWRPIGVDIPLPPKETIA